MTTATDVDTGSDVDHGHGDQDSGPSPVSWSPPPDHIGAARDLHHWRNICAAWPTAVAIHARLTGGWLPVPPVETIAERLVYTAALDAGDARRIPRPLPRPRREPAPRLTLPPWGAYGAVRLSGPVRRREDRG